LGEAEKVYASGGVLDADEHVDAFAQDGPGSRGRRNFAGWRGEYLVERLGRGSPVEGLAGSAVELGSNFLEMGFVVDGQIGAFREVLAQ
jgi:hypothetical protein